MTDGLVQRYPGRVRDFPPDETTLIGAGIGFSQSGLLPIVEIPYAKVGFRGCVLLEVSSD